MIFRSILSTLFIILFTGYSLGKAENYNLLLENPGIEGSLFCVDVLMGLEGPQPQLGSSEIYLRFSDGLTNPSIKFDNISDPPVYSTPTVAIEANGIASIKFDLLQPGSGDELTAIPGRTFLFRLCFEVTDQSIPIELAYIGTGVYTTIVRKEGVAEPLIANQLDFIYYPCFFDQQSCDDGDPNTTNDVVQPDCSCTGDPIAEFVLFVLLEGAYAGNGTMQDTLRSRGILPQNDPFGYGITASENLFADLGTNSVVDWIRIELRNPNDPTKLIAETAALVRRNGYVVQEDGTIGMAFPAVPAGEYFIVIDHPSHLPVMTRTAIDLSQNPVIDLTLEESEVAGIDQGAMFIENGFAAMLSGDANGDGAINAVDKNGYWYPQNGQPYVYGETTADFLMDGTVNAVDKNAIWIKNNSKVSFAAVKDTNSGGTIYTPNDSLKGRSGFPVGTAVKTEYMPDSLWREFSVREFDRLSIEFEAQPKFIQPLPGVFNWENTDSIVDYAERNGMDIHWHSLVYHAFTPTWMIDLAGDSAAIENALKTHIQTIVQRYKGRIKSYDVINEGLNDTEVGDPVTFFAEQLGPGYIGRCFQYARDIDPDALLLFNDYGTMWGDYKRQNLFNLLDDLEAVNAPIDGVGFQFHGNHKFPFFPEMDATINPVVDRGLMIHFSELDIAISHGGEFHTFTPALADEQRNRMKELVEYYENIPPALQFGITIWGYRDDTSWYNNGFVPYTEWPLMLDENGNYKLMHLGFLEGLQN